MTIFAIGVGSKIDEVELRAMSSGDQYTFKVKDFAALDSIKRRVSQSTCEGEFFVKKNKYPSFVAFGKVSQEILYKNMNMT